MTMNEEQQDMKLPSSFMDEKLFKSRSISIFGQINERIARTVTEQLLALEEALQKLALLREMIQAEYRTADSATSSNASSAATLASTS